MAAAAIPNSSKFKAVASNRFPLASIPTGVIVSAQLAFGAKPDRCGMVGCRVVVTPEALDVSEH
jgi:hypothetical protein